MTPNKVPLKWRIALTPVALIPLLYFIFRGALMGLVAWYKGLMEFWRGE